MIFKKYNSIENSFDEEFVSKVRSQMPRDLQYVVQEKVHGANASFLCDGTKIVFAKRTAVIENGEVFYDYGELVNTYRNNILALAKDVMGQYPGTVQVNIFGELFGGSYPHAEVKQVKNVKLVQKGIYYCPGHDFYGFDIYIQSEDEGHFLPVEETNALFQKHGFLYAKTLFTGSLEECLAHPNAFSTHIPEWLGLPPIEDNICEGIVIRPLVPMYLTTGARVLIKSKNSRFAEKRARKGPRPAVDPTAHYSEEMKNLMAVLATYITEPRLDNVISHIGEVKMPNDFGKLTGLYAKDVFDDFMKENAVSFDELENAEQKALKKELARMSAKQIQKANI
jgi:Rnl2 family RNA ligase